MTVNSETQVDQSGMDVQAKSKLNVTGKIIFQLYFYMSLYFL